jgi:hypothetical protein
MSTVRNAKVHFLYLGENRVNFSFEKLSSVLLHWMGSQPLLGLYHSCSYERWAPADLENGTWSNYISTASNGGNGATVIGT